MNTTKVVIKGKPKKIAALVLATQEQQERKVRLEMGGKPIAEAALGAMRDIREVRKRIVLEGADEYLNGTRAICEATELALKKVAQLNDALRELAELRKQVLL